MDFDLKQNSRRALNQLLQNWDRRDNAVTVHNPEGQHALAAGVNTDVHVTILGPAGYYCAGMNQKARVTVEGSAGVGVAENMMSGRVHVKGDASQSAGATAHGGLLVIDGNASARCGISMKGVNIVVKGSVGSMSAFMAQAGNMVVLGDAGEALGDSLYEAQLFVRGAVKSLGADCVQKPMTDEATATLQELLADAEADASIDDFKLYGSARKLYNFKIDNAGAY